MTYVKSTLFACVLSLGAALVPASATPACTIAQISPDILNQIQPWVTEDKARRVHAYLRQVDKALSDDRHNCRDRDALEKTKRVLQSRSPKSAIAIPALEYIISHPHQFDPSGQGEWLGRLVYHYEVTDRDDALRTLKQDIAARQEADAALDVLAFTGNGRRMQVFDSPITASSNRHAGNEVPDCVGSSQGGCAGL